MKLRRSGWRIFPGFAPMTADSVQVAGLHTMMEWLKTLSDWLRQPPRVIAAVALACAVILFAPDHVTDALKITDLRKGYGQYIGLGLLLCVALLGTHAVSLIWGFVHTRWLRFRVGQIRIRKLHELTAEERLVLCAFIKNQTKTWSLPITSGVVSGLEADQIIARSTILGGKTFDFNIQPWAWRYLNEHPEVLELTKTERAGGRPRKGRRQRPVET